MLTLAASLILGITSASVLISVPTGPAEIAPGYTPSQLHDATEFAAIVPYEDSVAFPVDLPAELHGDYRFALFRTPKHSYIVVVANIGGGVWRVGMDQNRDGRIETNEVRELVEAPGGVWARFVEEPRIRLGIQPRIDGGWPSQLMLQIFTLRRGTFTVDEDPYAFAIRGIFGRFGGESGRIWIDLNQDGNLDTTRAGNGSPESFKAGEQFFALGGHTFRFTIAPDGTEVSLERRERALPAGVRVDVGSHAPDITVRLSTGESLSLRDLRGSVVLLHWWAVACAPCREAMPEIARIYNARKNAGFEIVGLNVGDDPAIVLQYRIRAAMDWPNALLGDDDSLMAMYRISGVPGYVLVDAQGVIRKRGIGVKELDRAVQLLLPQQGTTAF